MSDPSPRSVDRSRAGHPSMFLVATLTTASGMMATRVMVPLLYGMRERGEPVEAVTIGLVTFASPVLTGVAIGLVRARATLVLTEAGLVAGSLAMQAGALEVWVAASAVGFALVGLTTCALTMRSNGPEGGAAFARAVVLGVGIDVGVHVAFGTWDPLWQGGGVPAAATLTLGALLGAATVEARRHVTPPGHAVHVLPVAALGPFLAVQGSVLANPAGLAATGPSLWFASTAVALGLAAGLAAMATWPRAWGPVPDLAGAVLAGLAVLILVVPGSGVPSSARALMVVGSVVCAQALLAPLLSAAASAGRREAEAGSEAWPVAVSIAVGAVGWYAAALAIQIDVVRPLPLPVELVLPSLAIGLGVAAATEALTEGEPSRSARRSGSGRLAVLPVAILALASFPRIGGVGAGAGSAESGSFRLVSWNVHSAVDRGGRVDPAAVADAIVAESADVIVLQEVARGWPIAGSLDLATWLAARLDMTMAWGPAADGRFGNLVLSRLPIERSRSWELPYGGGPQRRSAVMAVIDLGPDSVTVVDTHLESGSSSTRSQQIRWLLDALPAGGITVLAGDLNAQPDDPDLVAFEVAGLRSAQDSAGLGHVSTARDPAFEGDRVDLVFVGDGLQVADVAIDDADVSDHLPLAVSLTVRAG